MRAQQSMTAFQNMIEKVGLWKAIKNFESKMIVLGLFNMFISNKEKSSVWLLLFSLCIHQVSLKFFFKWLGLILSGITE